MQRKAEHKKRGTIPEVRGRRNKNGRKNTNHWGVHRVSKKDYLALNKVIGENELMRYFNSEEAQSHIKSEYEDCLEDFKNGDLNVECFREGEVGKVAYCLFMMYE